MYTYVHNHDLRINTQINITPSIFLGEFIYLPKIAYIHWKIIPASINPCANIKRTYILKYLTWSSVALEYTSDKFMCIVKLKDFAGTDEKAIPISNK